MNPQDTHESLSALLDGECQELELRRLLKAMDSDPALRAGYARLARSRSVLEPATAAWAGCDIAGRVQEAIDGVTVRRPLLGRLWQPLASAAIAASVAAAVVLGVAYLPSGSRQPTTEQAVASTVQAVHGPAITQNVSTAPEARPEAQPAAAVARIDPSRFQAYVERHAEYAALNSNTGLMSFARVASFEHSE